MFGSRPGCYKCCRGCVNNNGGSCAYDMREEADYNDMSYKEFLKAYCNENYCAYGEERDE